MAIQRPLKEGNVRTYQEKVGLGYLDILAAEMDADLDTIYAAWNGRVGTADLQDGAVTTPKLALGAVTTPQLGDGAVTTVKLGTGAVTNAQLGASAVTVGKLAAGATKRALVTATIATGFTATTGAWASLATLPALTTVGGVVLILGVAGLHYEGSNVENQLIVGLHRNGVLTAQSALTRFAAVTVGTYKTPFCPQIAFIDAPAAGTYTYQVSVLVVNAQGSIRGPSAGEGNPGFLSALELA